MEKVSAKFLRLAQAPIVPMFVKGANGIGFQVAGLVHPAIRTALLPREVSNKRGTHLHLRFGTLINTDELEMLDDPARIERCLRVRLYALGARMSSEKRVLRSSTARSEAPIAESPSAIELAKEVAGLPEIAVLTRVGHLTVYCSAASSIPKILREIGRLREITF